MSFFNRIITTSIIFFLVFFIGACQEPDSAISNIINSERELKTIKIAVGEWDPFVSKNSEEGYGETSEIVTAILEEIGYKPEYNFMPWGEAEEIVQENQKDEGLRITFPYPESTDRQSKFLISKCDTSVCDDNKDGITKADIGFFYNTKKIGDISPISSTSELEQLIKKRKLTLGYIGKKYGYQYTDKIQELIKNSKTVEATNDYHSFQNLINNKVDIVIDYIRVGEQLLYDYFPEKKDDIKLVEEKSQSEDAKPYVHEAQLYLIASRKNPHNSEFIKEFNETHAKLIKNKTIDKIENRARLRPSYKNPRVFLDRCESSYKILGHDNRGNTYQIPRGTTGLLETWSSYKSKQPKDIETKTTVLILTGPYRGKLLTIDGKCVILD